MKEWFSKRKNKKTKMVFGFNEDFFCQITAEKSINNQWSINRILFEERKSQEEKQFFNRIKGLGVTHGQGLWELLPSQYRLFQLEKPANIEEHELEQAMRYQLLEPTGIPFDDLQMSIIEPEHNKDNNQIIIATSSRAWLKQKIRAIAPLNIKFDTIDIQETALRDLFYAHNPQLLKSKSVLAGLFLTSDRTAVLLIFSQGDICFSKRFEADEHMYSTQILPRDASNHAHMYDDKLNEADFDAPRLDSAFLEDDPTVAPRNIHFDVNSLHLNEVFSGATEDQNKDDIFITELQKYLDMWDYNHPNMALSGIYISGWSNSDVVAKKIADFCQRQCNILKNESLFSNLNAATSVPPKYLISLLGGFFRN